MFASHRPARAIARFAVVLMLGVPSCARGRQTAEGSPYGVTSPFGSSLPDTPEASTPFATYGTPDDDAADEGAPETAVAVLTDDAGDDATDPESDDASDEPSVDPGATSPVPGEIAITEVMLSPSGPEPQSEWFEIYNLASSPRLLGGLTIEDGYGDVAVIASTPTITVSPATYALLVRDKRGAERTGISAPSITYAYGEGLAPGDGIELDEGAAGDLSLWNDRTLLAQVPYGMWDASWLGQSIELASPQSDETDPGQWCIAQSPWAFSSDDGTPGAPNDCGP